MYLLSSTALFVTSVNAELVSRLGGSAVYDTDLNITWIADANLALTNQFGLTITVNEHEEMPYAIGSTGMMTWDNATAWIEGMNAANYLGFNDWRLPTTLVPDSSCSDEKSGWSPVSNNDSIGYNCILVPNGPLIPDAGGNSQLDTDGVGYGNLCDPDFDNSGNVDFSDLRIWNQSFSQRIPMPTWMATVQWIFLTWRT